VHPTRRYPSGPCGLILAIAVACLFSLVVATAAEARNFHCGRKVLKLHSRGPCVRGLQWMLHGHAPMLKRYRRSFRKYGIKRLSVDGRYGPRTRRAVRRAKYLMGFAARYLVGVRSGPQLWAYIRGWRRLPRDYKRRRQRRITFLRNQRRTRGRLGSVGIVTLAPWARPPKRYVLRFVARVSGIVGHPLIVVSGFRENSRVVGTGRLSQHATGDAADIGTPTYGENQRVGHAALIAAGMPRSRAFRMHDPWDFGFRYNGWNIIFGCNSVACGGNHLNHVHVGGPGHFP
jgi:hypothetical protein